MYNVFLSASILANSEAAERGISSLSMRGSRGGGGWQGFLTPPPPLKNYKNIGFLSNTGLDPLKNHKATKLAFNVGQSSAFRWRADNGPLLVVFGSSPLIN